MVNFPIFFIFLWAMTGLQNERIKSKILCLIFFLYHQTLNMIIQQNNQFLITYTIVYQKKQVRVIYVLLALYTVKMDSTWLDMLKERVALKYFNDVRTGCVLWRGAVQSGTRYGRHSVRYPDGQHKEWRVHCLAYAIHLASANTIQYKACRPHNTNCLTCLESTALIRDIAAKTVSHIVLYRQV